MSTLPINKLPFALSLMLVLVYTAHQVCTIAHAEADEPPVAIETREAWSGVFGGTDVKFGFSVTPNEKVDGIAAWSFSANKRTISRGQQRLKVDAGQSEVVTVPLRVPTVKQGVVFEAQLRVQVVAQGASDSAAELIKPIWIFPDDPFYNRKTWLEELNIALFDPVGETEKVFDKAEIPYRLLPRSSAIEALEKGIVIVGEGVSLDSFRGLFEGLTNAAARGVPVLCLAPGEGSFPLPGASGDGAALQCFEFRRGDVVTELDKRLDAEGWPPAGELVSARLAVTSRRSQVLVEVARSTRAWPWLEWRYPDDGATFIICGFGIMRHWDDGPTPRYLLARILERLEK